MAIVPEGNLHALNDHQALADRALLFHEVERLLRQQQRAPVPAAAPPTLLFDNSNNNIYNSTSTTPAPTAPLFPREAHHSVTAVPPLPSRTEQQPTKENERSMQPLVKPKKCLTGYNFFFQAERNKLTQEIAAGLRPKCNFADLARHVSKCWKQISDSDRAHYMELGRVDRERYDREMALYERHAPPEAWRKPRSRKPKYPSSLPPSAELPTHGERPPVAQETQQKDETTQAKQQQQQPVIVVVLPAPSAASLSDSHVAPPQILQANTLSAEELSLSRLLSGISDLDARLLSMKLAATRSSSSSLSYGLGGSINATPLAMRQHFQLPNLSTQHPQALNEPRTLR